jgi:hypothetical protein
MDVVGSPGGDRRVVRQPERSVDREFAQAAAKLDEALARQTPSGIITTFRAFRSQAAKCFYQADERLKELCESLRRVDGPLNSVLSIIERTI